ncbi:tryptophan synthase subunit alpha [soil metagenome]
MTKVQSSAAVGSAAQSSAIGAVFDACSAAGRAALMPFITVGYPNLKASGELLEALVRGGADLIEIGVPFSDPLADGATVQHASQVALEQGTTLDDCFDRARAFRARGHTTPLIFMGYSNPFLQYGLDRLARVAADAGVNGFIVPDLPLEESDEFAVPFRAHGLDLIFMVAPTSTAARLREAAARASGFIYCVSLTGVTGARSTMSGGLREYMARVRAVSSLPLAIGFGISTPDHVREASSLADGVIVASALINHIDSVPAVEQANEAEEFVRSLAAATGKRQ